MNLNREDPKMMAIGYTEAAKAPGWSAGVQSASPAIVTVIGFVVSETDEGYLLCQSIQGDRFENLQMIPRRAILGMAVLVPELAPKAEEPSGQEIS